MKRVFPILGLLTCLNGVPVTSNADLVQWPSIDKTYTNAGLLNGTHLLPWDQVNVTGRFSHDSEMAFTPDVFGGHSLQTCIQKFSVCIPDRSVDAMLLLTDQRTLIGHLTLDEYASLAEIAAVTDMYLTDDALTVRFFGGALPGSLLSVFETSFEL